MVKRDLTLHSLGLQIVEMLEMFSTSPDKTVGPEDFEKIMAATRLV
jgi:hypothetical protein